MAPTVGGVPAARTVLVVFLALLAATLGAFALTRALRAQDDIVNAVEIEGHAGGGEKATIRFTLVAGDQSADVLIVDRDGLSVRALLLNQPLAAGAHEFVWDGRLDDGAPAEPGRYGLRVILDEQGRDIRPGGRVHVESEAR